ncbi:MAG: hypothetical protein ACKOZL_02640 [Actinomycetes bacterium]
MKVLVLEAEPGAAEERIAQLAAGGHEVVRCHVPGQQAFPCVGLVDGGACPLECGGVDVALTVRRKARSVPTPHEDGAACAIRNRVPLVVTGETALNPYTALGAIEASGDDLEAVLAEAVRDARPDHSEVALGALIASLRANDEPTSSANARVWRARTGLHAVLEVPESVPQRLRDMAAVRVTSALRAYDRFAAQINVSIESV